LFGNHPAECSLELNFSIQLDFPACRQARFVSFFDQAKNEKYLLLFESYNEMVDNQTSPWAKGLLCIIIQIITANQLVMRLKLLKLSFIGQ
jgi:hypothetical protein